jgi:hypothetical protein
LNAKSREAFLCPIGLSGNQTIVAPKEGASSAAVVFVEGFIGCHDLEFFQVIRKAD